MKWYHIALGLGLAVAVLYVWSSKKKTVFQSTETDPARRQLQEAIARSYGMTVV